MSEEKKRQIAGVFDEISPRYDNNRFFTLSAERLVEQLGPCSEKRMLDIATGTGIVAITAARHCPTMAIEAIDISGGMLAEATAKAAAEGLSEIRFTQMDAESLDFPEQSFDLITCGYGLFFLPCLEQCFADLYARLRPGGRMVFSSFAEGAFAPYDTLFLELLQVFGVEPPSLSWRRLQTREQIVALCDGRPASSLRIELYPIRYPLSLDEWWGMLNNAGYRALINQLDPELLPEFRQRLVGQARELAGGDTLQFNVDTLFTIIERH